MNILPLFKKIRAFVFDVDGVLTDGTLVVMSDGLQARTMHIKDGLALQMAVKKGYLVKIISGSESAPVKERLQRLGIEDISMGVQNKKQEVLDFISGKGLKSEEVLFMGDDLPDVAAMETVGLPCCPADAIDEVKKIAQYISHFVGGKACVRDVIEKVLKLNDHWQFSDDITSK
jgi:3-deoxy-D-manno-octulosonate 8-phosphate phosphatase (KDO 8-P phosphatase)